MGAWVQIGRFLVIPRYRIPDPSPAPDIERPEGLAPIDHQATDYGMWRVTPGDRIPHDGWVWDNLSK